jgi:hypothetical protein
LLDVIRTDIDVLHVVSESASRKNPERGYSTVEAANVDRARRSRSVGRAFHEVGSQDARNMPLDLFGSEPSAQRHELPSTAKVACVRCRTDCGGDLRQPANRFVLQGEYRMLRNLDDLLDRAIHATDGDIGQVKDFYLDDQAWVVRYLVVETGSWLASRKVLVSPVAISLADSQEKMLAASITREQVKNSPDIDTDKPVSRQHEMDFLGYYAYPLYWGGPGLWGAGSTPNRIMPEFVSTPSVIKPQADSVRADIAAARDIHTDPHLRSCSAVMSYHVHATDGDIGHVEGLLVDERTWAIRYLIVNTSNWWLGHQVLIAPDLIREVSWADGVVSLNLTRQKIKDAPAYDPAVQVDRMHETSVYKHYGNMAYWVKEQVPDAPRAANPR